MKLPLIACIFIWSWAALPSTHVVDSNAFYMANAPKWLTRNRAEKTVDRIQTQLEWTIRKVTVHWHADDQSFTRAHSLGPHVMAVARRVDNSIHLGPKVSSDNFDQVFGHELVHIILFQKYQNAIPAWLEEGLANYLARKGKADYAFLQKRPFPDDVRRLAHPHRKTLDEIRYHYTASQALAEMIAKKCDLTNLLRLSVQRRMDDYLRTYCEITNLNASFQAWVQKGGR